jgi:5-formyltetrahydrofolate cyclo-ligase
MNKRTDGAAGPVGDAPREYSSPACYLHEFESTEGSAPPAGAASPQPGTWEEIRQWRKRTREELIARRLELPSHMRRAKGQQALQRLVESVDLRQFATIGIYWPMRGEIDARSLARKHLDAGGHVGLPVVVTRGAPVEFWKWRPGTKMRPGLWDIPIPEEREVLQPEALIVPLVGFDAAGYRLGYGGGYYDRTLAAAKTRPYCIGLGYAEAHLNTIYPQPHDIPMNIIVTDRLVTRRDET